MIDRYLGEVLDGENRVSQVQVGTTCTGHERSAITQIANGREREYREYWRDRGRRETTVRSRSHPDRHSGQTDRSGQARERYRSIISVLVEAAARLAPQPAGLDVAAQQWAWAVLVVPEPVVQHLHDRQAGVQADQVGQRERAHRVVHAQPHYGVDRLAVAHALHQAVDRLVDHRHQDSVGDEPG